MKATVEKVGKNVARKLFEITGKEVSVEDKPCHFCKDLIEGLVERFKAAKSRKDMYMILTSAPKCVRYDGMRKTFGAGQRMALNAIKLRDRKGPLSFPELKPGKSLNEAVVEHVKNFYLSEENSRPSPNIRDTVYVTENGVREKKAKHRMLINLRDLYTLFRKKYPEDIISVSKFAQLRPRQCQWPGHAGFHTVCCCQLHENFRLLLKVADPKLKSSDYVAKLLCNPPTEDCYLSVCETCPNDNVMDELFEKIGNAEDDITVSVDQWTGGGDRSDLVTMSWEFDEYKEKLIRFQFQFLEHAYINQQQTKFFRNLREHVLPTNPDAAMITMDFSSNYSYVVQNETYVSNHTYESLMRLIVYRLHAYLEIMMCEYY